MDVENNADIIYPPRNFLLRFLQIIYSLYAVVNFIITMFIALVFVLVSPIFGKTKGGNFVYHWFVNTGHVYGIF